MQRLSPTVQWTCHLWLLHLEFTRNYHSWRQTVSLLSMQALLPFLASYTLPPVTQWFVRNLAIQAESCVYSILWLGVDLSLDLLLSFTAVSADAESLFFLLFAFCTVLGISSLQLFCLQVSLYWANVSIFLCTIPCVPSYQILEIGLHSCPPTVWPNLVLIVERTATLPQFQLDRASDILECEQEVFWSDSFLTH